jgi:hypothetical protein
MSKRDPAFMRERANLTSYTSGYIRAMQDILEDNQLLLDSQPGYREPWQLITKVRQSLIEAERTLEIMVHDEEVGSTDDI